MALISDILDFFKINRLVGTALFERLGCTVDVVTSGAEAVEAVPSARYDAVLMDCVMPEHRRLQGPP